MPELELLRPDHAPALLRFELANRAYFAALLAEQAAGTCRFHVLVEDDGEVVGRVNLVDIAGGSAELGYRIAEHATGRGLATAAVRRVCELACTDHGLTSLRAATTADNSASQAVLTRAGFQVVGTADVDGDVRYVRELPEDGSGR